MAIVIGDFEVVEPAPAPPSASRTTDDQLPANTGQTAQEVEQLMRHQSERHERVRAH